MYTPALFSAIALGLLPALFWLWFWLREDKKHPEPKILIILAFLAGMSIVFIVLPLQEYAFRHTGGTPLLVMWVVIEEVAKYIAALCIVLWNKAVDEPIDAIIYMIAIALGFSAFENALYAYTPLTEASYGKALLMTNFRFVGATLLHLLASSTIGVFMALVFYKGTLARVLGATIGLFVAILLHTLFNFFIMSNDGERTMFVFMAVWLGIIVLFLFFEKIKLITKPH